MQQLTLHQLPGAAQAVPEGDAVKESARTIRKAISVSSRTVDRREIAGYSPWNSGKPAAVCFSVVQLSAVQARWQARIVCGVALTSSTVQLDSTNCSGPYFSLLGDFSLKKLHSSRWINRRWIWRRACALQVVSSIAWCEILSTRVAKRSVLCHLAMSPPLVFVMHRH